MLKVTANQMLELNEIALQGYIKTQLDTYAENTKPTINHAMITEWVKEGHKFGITHTGELNKYIELNVGLEKMRVRPYEVGILYYLTHSSMTPKEKLNSVEHHILKP